MKMFLAGILLALCLVNTQAQFYLSFEGSITEGSCIDGVLEGGATFEDSKFGQALCTDGIDGAADLGNLRDQCFGNLDLCKDGITVAFMLWPGDQEMSGSKEVYYLSSGGQTTSSYGFAIYRRFDRLVASASTEKEWLEPPKTEDVGYPIKTGNRQPYYVVFTWRKDAGFTLYVDGEVGVQMAAGTGRARDLKGTPFNNFFIGRPNNGKSHYGKMCIDDLIVYPFYMSPDNFAKSKRKQIKERKEVYGFAYYFPMECDASDLFDNIPATLEGGAALAVLGTRRALCTDGETGAVDLGVLRDKCLGNLEKCPDGITLSFNVTVGDQQMSGSKEVYIMSGGGQTSASHGIAIYRRFNQLQAAASTSKEWLQMPKTDSAGFTMTPETWYYVVFTWKEDIGFTVYVEGERAFEMAAGSGTPRDLQDTTFNNFLLGRPNNAMDHYAQMCIDDFEVWNSYVTDDQAKALYEGCRTNCAE